MKRDLHRLVDETFDVLIIGGGIYGAATARAAVLRGLHVALIEQADFGHATSANSLKVIHGGLRYLQHADLKRMRESIKARSCILRLAPHLIQLQPFIIPIYGHGIRGKEIMATALAINELISWDRNHSVHPMRRIPAGRILSKQECLSIVPGLDRNRLTGGALWFDCVVQNTERLTLSFILSAVENGACVANYVRANSYIVNHDAVTGVTAVDSLTQEFFDIRARLIINAAGPWVNELSHSIPYQHKPDLCSAWAKAANIVVRRRLFGDYAVGIATNMGTNEKEALSNKSPRYYFFVPWREGTLIGTSYKPYIGSPGACRIEEQDIKEIVEQVNQIYPPAQLTTDDISFFHAGLLPMAPRIPSADPYLSSINHAQVWDYEKSMRLRGLIAVTGVKYTTAYQVAARIAELAIVKLGKNSSFRLSEPPLPGGDEVVTDMPESAQTNKNVKLSGLSISPRVLKHLKRQFGTRYETILDYVRKDPCHGEPVSPMHETISAEIIHAVREEMAQKLTDVILRRTELGNLACPDDPVIYQCATIMARELGWGKQRMQNEIETVKQIYKVTDRAHSMF